MIRARILPVKSTVLLLLLTVFTFESMGQAVPVINQKQEQALKSKLNGTTYQLKISLPKHYSSKDTVRYPVLYLLDGGLGFPIAHSARTALDMIGGLEDVIIVGIDYEFELSYTPWFTGRWRDYTPGKDANLDVNPGFIKGFGLPEGSLSSGGAPVFLNVIRNEIIPLIEREYKTNGDRGISGHSFGGLFAGYCLFEAHDLFKRFGVNSPSFWWNNKAMFEVEKKFSESHTSLPVTVFMSVGSLEGASMTPVMTAFADALKSRNYKGLDLKTFVFEGETHNSVMPAMIGRTLRVLYGKK
jgi:predicted alpha/beta superfamily hydrolase